ncbi:MAG: hypothetical protein ACRCYU_14380 [Nocardioides sp.]
MIEHVWIDGLRTPVEEDDWANAAASFMGRGYRTSFPLTTDVAEPANFHRQMALRVANTFGLGLDEAPWDFVTNGNLPPGSAIEIVSGWRPTRDSTASGDPTGPATAWTAVARVESAPHDSLRADAVSLPWAYNSQSPLAGMPLLSRVEDDQARRHLREVGADLGLWWNADGQLADSTHGTPLVRVGQRSWAFPHRSASSPSSWIFFNIASLLGAIPTRLTSEALEASSAVVFIDSIGKITVLKSLNGAAKVLDREAELTVLSTRLGLIS